MKLEKALKKFKKVESLTLNMYAQDTNSLLYWLVFAPQFSVEERVEMLKDYMNLKDWKETK